MQLENKANWNNKYINYMAVLNKYYTLDEILLTDQAELRFNWMRGHCWKHQNKIWV